jgi:NTE family protein
MKGSRLAQKSITLALQGGGSHGAFTWGVLDRLLEESRFEIEGISGASAGAMNAIVLAQGYMQDGRDGARQALKNFWESVAIELPFNAGNADVPAAHDIASQSDLPSIMNSYISMMRYFSPQQINPFDLNPLRDILTAQIDFQRLRTESPIKLFIATTRVSTGTLKLFRNKQLSLEVLLASACLPLINRAVEIDGEAYWDGGFTANPPLFPLIHKCSAKDILVVLLHPEARMQVPASATEIWHRLTEMGFSASFFTELQGVMLAKREAERSWFAIGRLERRLRQLMLHRIESPQLMGQLGMHSKMNAQAGFLNSLHLAGRAQATQWLANRSDRG